MEAIRGTFSRGLCAVAAYFFRPNFKYQLGISRVFLYLTVLWTIINQLALFSVFG
jgi:hypothetical protein